MRKLRRSKLIIVLAAVFILFTMQASAAVEPAIIENSANSLVKLGIMYFLYLM